MRVWVVEVKIRGRWVPYSMHRSRAEARRTMFNAAWLALRARIRQYAPVPKEKP